MGISSFLLVIVLFSDAAQIMGEIISNPTSQQQQNDSWLPQTVVRTDIKGRLLTPEEGCGHSKVPNMRIVGGTAAKNGAWPWMVLLGEKSGWNIKFKCGGTLITSRHVLTAAHCLNIKITFARLGEYDTNTVSDGKHEDIEVVRQTTHEEWNRALLINDIAILELAHDVTFTDRISPICLPDSELMQSIDYVDFLPFVTGWGHSKEKGRLSNILQQVQLPVISNEECKEKYSTHGRIVEDIRFSNVVLCAGYAAGGKDTCQGDSGGPMMMPVYVNGEFPFYQIGISSYGTGCARPNVPGVYTNVRHYIEWINSNLQ